MWETLRRWRMRLVRFLFPSLLHRVFPAPASCDVAPLLPIVVHRQRASRPGLPRHYWCTSWWNARSHADALVRTYPNAHGVATHHAAVAGDYAALFE